MKISEAIREVKEFGGHKKQFQYDTMMSDQYRFLAKVIKNLKRKPETVLDAGCAYGTFSYWLKKNGYGVTSLDVDASLHNEKLFEEAKIPFLKLDIEKDLIPEKYDLIVFTEVLEHLNSNPLPTLEKLRGRLKSKGQIILSTPSREVDPPQQGGKWVNYVNWRQIPKNQKYTDGNHHYYYIWELAELIVEAGLVIAALYRTKLGWFFILEVK